MARRIAVLFDIHGNLPALEAVLDEVRSVAVDRVVVGGDVVPGPMPSASLDLLEALELPVDYISGNGEREVLASLAGQESESLPPSVRAAIHWSGQALTKDQRDQVASWPATLRIEIDEPGPVFFCHATPESDSEIFTPRTPRGRLTKLFGSVSDRLIVCGHTHMQFQITVGSTSIFNAGSVGMPFGRPGAYWMLLGPDVEFRRTAYDLKEASERIRATAYPGADGFAARNVVSPPSEEQMLDLFEGGG